MVDVTKADREAAAEHAADGYEHRNGYTFSHQHLILNGELDSHPLVKAFARHRTNHTMPNSVVDWARKEAAMLREIAASEARGVDWQANLNATANFLALLSQQPDHIPDAGRKVDDEQAEGLLREVLPLRKMAQEAAQTFAVKQGDRERPIWFSVNVLQNFVQFVQLWDVWDRIDSHLKEQTDEQG